MLNNHNNRVFAIFYEQKWQTFFQHSAQCAVRHIFLPSHFAFWTSVFIMYMEWLIYHILALSLALEGEQHTHKKKKKYCAVWHLQHAFIVKLKNFSLSSNYRSLACVFIIKFYVQRLFVLFFRSLPFSTFCRHRFCRWLFFLGGKNGQ